MLPFTSDAPSLIVAAEKGQEDHAMAEQRYSRAAIHDPLLELQMTDPVIVDAGVERGGDFLDDCGLVLPQCFGQASQGREA
ncbi:hypothetical protein GCM10010245_92220 [Streptomyces spectabilis]|nr:hypothetical protein GCM10010245_92220 [Streptomyces spectabilis]